MIESIVRLYAEKAGSQYGSEAVSQLEHALQCAQLALDAGASSELAAAAFLHDIGHLVAPAPHELGRDVDDVHQYLALTLLRPGLGKGEQGRMRVQTDGRC